MLMLHMGRVSGRAVFSGTLSIEWTVFLAASSVEAILLAAVAVAISPRDLIFDRMVARRKVLPVQPGALTNITPPLPPST